MESEISGKNCFICCEKPLNFHDTSDPELNICQIICRHFWFKEDDLGSAIVCGLCWEKVDQFHQFYLNVEKLHGQLEIFIKQEEIEIEADQLLENYLELPGNDEKPFDMVECKLETVKECNEPLKVESGQEPRKKRKYTRRAPGEKIAKRKYNVARKLTSEERQAEQDFIKEHMNYLCKECNMEFENFRSIRRHRKKTHNKNSVECCGTQYRTPAALFEHVQNALNPEAFKCEICSSTFKSHNGYLRHKDEYHTAKKEPIVKSLKCHRCEKSYAKQADLKSHLKGHENLHNGSVKCEFCGKCFGHERFLRYHIKTVHQKATEFMCEICSKGFGIRSAFLAHRKRHDLTAEQMRTQCPICNKWLRKFSYWRHVRRHEEDGKEYKCEMCAHVSISLMALKVHIMRKHTPGKKSHACELCGKEYSRPTTLREHIANAHTGEHLYQCQYCDKKFFSLATTCSHRKKKHPKEWQADQLAKYAPADSGGLEGAAGGTVS